MNITSKIQEKKKIKPIKRDYIDVGLKHRNIALTKGIKSYKIM